MELIMKFQIFIIFYLWDNIFFEKHYYKFVPRSDGITKHALQSLFDIIFKSE